MSWFNILKLSAKQKKIAELAEPKDKIDEKDLEELRKRKMTRCTFLDSWFDAKSKELDKAEKEQKKDLITGVKQ